MEERLEWVLLGSHLVEVSDLVGIIVTALRILITIRPGYSWLSNQYGLSIDNVLAFELVLPTGEVETITETSNADLWFALRVRVSTSLYNGLQTKINYRVATTTLQVVFSKSSIFFLMILISLGNRN